MRVIVVGGGIIGCSVAWRLAQRGAHVTMLEKYEPGTKATWAAAGMLLPLMEPNSPLQPLTDASLAVYPAFVQELQEVTGIDAALQLESAQRGSVDNRKLGRAAYIAAVAVGVDVMIGVAARRIHHVEGRVHRVELGDETSLICDVVIVAAGAWSGELLGLPHRLPVVPVRGQMLALEHEQPLVTGIVKGERCYLVPRGETRTLIGATVERVGFDEGVTAQGIEGLLACASGLVPDVVNARVVEQWAGLRPGTPDDLPILGEDSRVRGVYYATGHYRNGILLAPITAHVIADLVMEGSTEFDLSAFALDRFIVDVNSPRCDLCGGPMSEWHCRIICTRCGYQRDCSDP